MLTLATKVLAFNGTEDSIEILLLADLVSPLSIMKRCIERKY